MREGFCNKAETPHRIREHWQSQRHTHARKGRPSAQKGGSITGQRSNKPSDPHMGQRSDKLGDPDPQLPGPEAFDGATFEALEQYLEALQSGRRPDRQALLDRHPELASTLACLEVLDRMAPDESGRGEAGPRVDEAAGEAGGGQGAVAGEYSDRLPERFPRPFGAYELLAEIGRGGMGVVFKARQQALDRMVAVKMILAHHLAAPEMVRRFRLEARAAARLEHSNIVHIHEVGCLHGQHYLVMEYVGGGNLAQRIAQGPVEPEEAATIVAEIARAVDHLHQAGIVHRDLKPSNVLLDDEGHPHVTDFGLAKLFEPGSETTATAGIAGTAGYMAPEQAAGHGARVGPAADVYGLGAILYEMLTGKPPFAGESMLDVLLEVVSREAASPRRLRPEVPVELELICMRCLAKRPEDRYDSAGALADDLDRFVRGEPLETRPPGVTRRLWSWTRRQPALALRLGALAVFYLVEVVNYLLGAPGVDWTFHWKITGLLGAWVAGCWGCQWLLDRQRWSIPARFVWGGLDSVILFSILWIADGAASPLVVGYPLLIVGSAFWFRVRFVWFMTITSLLSYGVLVVDFYLWRHIDEPFDPAFDRHLIFAVGLALLGLAVAYLVYRVRVLSSFYGQRPP